MIFTLLVRVTPVRAQYNSLYSLPTVGVYVPFLARQVLNGILNGAFNVPFKGVLVGNGVSNAPGKLPCVLLTETLKVLTALPFTFLSYTDTVSLALRCTRTSKRPAPRTATRILVTLSLTKPFLWLMVLTCMASTMIAIPNVLYMMKTRREMLVEMCLALIPLMETTT